MDSVLCIPGNKMGVILSERDHPLCLIQCEQGRAAIVVYVLHIQWPLCSGSCFYWGSESITKAPTINTLLRMWGHSNVTSQGASSLECLEDQQMLELWVNGSWEGAEQRKYGPCAPWAPWWASLGVCLIAGEFVLPSFREHSDLKGAISVLIQITW